MSKWQEIVELGESATERPWVAEESPGSNWEIAPLTKDERDYDVPDWSREIGMICSSEDDAQLICAACNAAPDMAARLLAIEALAKRYERVGASINIASGTYAEVARELRALLDPAALTSKETK